MKVRRGNKPYSSGGSSENTSDSLEDDLAAAQEFPTVDVREQCPKFSSIVDGRPGKVSQ